MKSQEDLKDLHGKGYVTKFQKEQSPSRLRRLLKLIEVSDNSNIVDFGCGDGMLMELLAPFVNSYTGVDFSPPFIAAALERRARLDIKNSTFECMDIHEFCGMHKNKFDIAFAMDFSEHVYDKEWIKILSSIRETLEPGGVLYMHTPNRDFILEIIKDKNFILKQPPQHIAVRNVQDNERLVQAAGFSEVSSKLIPHYNVLRYLHPLSFLPVAGRFFQARIFMKSKK